MTGLLRRGGLGRGWDHKPIANVIPWFCRRTPGLWVHLVFFLLLWLDEWYFLSYDITRASFAMGLSCWIRGAKCTLPSLLKEVYQRQ
jgi:hypothetical protein